MNFEVFSSFQRLRTEVCEAEEALSRLRNTLTARYVVVESEGVKDYLLERMDHLLTDLRNIQRGIVPITFEI